MAGSAPGEGQAASTLGCPVGRNRGAAPGQMLHGESTEGNLLNVPVPLELCLTSEDCQGAADQTARPGALKTARAAQCDTRNTGAGGRVGGQGERKSRA